MSCIIHQEREASGTCSNCGSFLCYECVSLFNPPMCANCAIEIGREAKGKLIGKIIFSVILAIVGGIIGYLIWSIGAALIIALLFAGLPWGFTATPILTAGVFATQGCGWGIFYYVIKLAVSALIGVFVMPFQIIKLGGQISLSKTAYTLFE